jgi:hypothetical protein
MVTATESYTFSVDNRNITALQGAGKKQTIIYVSNVTLFTNSLSEVIRQRKKNTVDDLAEFVSTCSITAVWVVEMTWRHEIN